MNTYYNGREQETIIVLMPTPKLRYHISKLKKNPLTPVEIEWVDHYFEYRFNGTAASLATPDLQCNGDKGLAKQYAKVFLRNLKIQDLIQETKKELINKALITKEDIILDLYSVVNEHRNNKDKRYFLQALDILNKMFGYYVPQEVKLDVTYNAFFPGMENIKPLIDQSSDDAEYKEIERSNED